ncbi:MAG TPA: LysR substrate-binding domain-containing protein [Stellaceae bacterium]|nr:LysR substrate-binding domain-containing protein [Stellaceae bacterium]
MRPHIPSLSALQAFEAAARLLSFTRAADELNITQSAISRHISGLEARLGVKLFRRERRRINLSDAGAAYLPEVRASLDRIEASTQQILTHRRGAGALNLATLPTFGAKWLAPRLAEFQALHPNIVMNFAVRTEPFDFAGSDLDAAIHFGLLVWPNVVAERLIGEELVPVCSRRLKASLDAAGGPQELTRFPLLELTPLADAWDQWLRAAGAARQGSGKGFRFEHFTMAIQATISHAGILLVPHFLVADDIREGRLAVAYPMATSTEMAYYLIYPQAKANLPAFGAFRAWILERAAATEEECREFFSTANSGGGRRNAQQPAA